MIHQHHDVFLPCGLCILQVQAWGMYLSLGARLLLLGIWYRTIWSYSMQVIVIGCVLSRYEFKMHHFACGWCLHTFFFRDKGEGGATPSESPWTLQLKRSRVVFSNPMYFAIFLQCTVTENLNQVYNL